MTDLVPPRRTGPLHLVAATVYSLQGLRRLMREVAFRHEVLAAAVLLPGLWALGAPSWALAIQAVLLLVLMALEALNTAIEELVDHLTRAPADFARNAKDLGSVAVMGLILANALWAAESLWLALAP